MSGINDYAKLEVLVNGEQAKQKLKEAGFKKTDSEYKYSTTTPEGDCMGTDPEIGTKVPADTTITVIVSKGTESAVVPSLVGLTAQEAESKLASAGRRGLLGQK